ncbi:hypothetical protein [Geoglobus ahangari]
MEYIKMSKDILDILSGYGVTEFHVFEFSGNYSVEEVEEKFRAEFDNSIINVFKIGEGSFIVEVFVVDEKLDELKRAHLESYIHLSGLERFAMLYGDRDLEYVVKKFIKSDKKRVYKLNELL